MKTLSRLFAVVVVGVSCLQIFAAPEPGLKQYRLKWSSGDKYFTPDDWQTAWDGNDPVVMPGALMAKKANMSGTTWKGVSYPFVNYSGYWYEGYIKLEGGKTYSAKSSFDDGGCVYIDGQMVYQQGSTSGYSGASPSFTPVPFVCNKSGWYKLQLGMWDWGGGRNIFSGTIAIVQWSDGDPAVVVTDYSAKYWNEFWDADSEGTALGTYLYTEIPDSIKATLEKNAIDSYSVHATYIGQGATANACWVADGVQHWETPVAVTNEESVTFTFNGLPADKSINFLTECRGLILVTTNIVGSALTGNLSATAGVNAKESDGTPGTIIVSRPDTASTTAGDLVVNYTVSPSSTAVVGVDYKELPGSVTIPSGSASAAIEIHPYANPGSSASPSVSITLSEGNYGIATATAGIIIENSDFSAPIRYVNEKGSDSDNGLNPNNPYKTIWHAVNELAGNESETSYVYVAPGIYSETNTSYAVTLSNAIEVVGMSGNAADVIVKASAGNTGIFKLTHAGAVVRNLTMSGGQALRGGNAIISAGLIENCVLENGKATNWDGGGGNVLCSGGRVTRCVLKGGSTSPSSTNYRQCGGGFYLSGGLIENCLITGNKDSYCPAGRIDGAGTLLNCTITGNTNSKTASGENGPIVYLSNAKAKMINCAIYGNTVASDPTGMSAFYGLSSAAPASAVENCPITLTDADFVDFGGGNFTPNVNGALTDAGVDYAAAGGVSTNDCNGLRRISGSAVDIGAFEHQYSASFIQFDGPPTFQWSAGQSAFAFTIGLKEGAGSVYGVFTDKYDGRVFTNLVTSSAVAGQTYTLVPTLPENRSYSCMAYGVSLDNDVRVELGTNLVYFGEISIVKTGDAEEATFKSGGVIVSRAPGVESTSEPIEVALAISGTATPGKEYMPIPSSVTIPANQAAVAVPVVPMVCPEVTENRTVTLRVLPAFCAAASGDPVSVTIVNDPNPYTGEMRFVTEDGDDVNNDGKSVANAFATVAHAVSDLGSDGGRVYVAAGTYAEAASDTVVTVNDPIEIVGMTGNPKDVILTRSTSTGRIVKMNNASALVKYVTIKDGKITAHGGQGPNVYLMNGTIEDCVITGGYNGGNGGNEAGGNVYQTGGRIARCEISNASVPNFNSGRANRRAGSAFVIDAGVIENCLITGNTGGLTAGMLFGSGKVLNCTFVGNNCPCGGVAVFATGAKTAVVRNSIIYGNTSSRSGAPDSLKCYLDKTNDWGIDYTASGFNKNSLTNAFENCLGDVQINSRCIAGNPWYRDPDNGDYRVGTQSPAHDASVGYAESGATSTKDLKGGVRVVGAAADLGAYEYQTGDVYGEILFELSSSITPATLTAQAVVNGLVGDIDYWWDLDGDGTYEIHKINDPSLSYTHTYGMSVHNTVAMKAEVDGYGVVSSISRHYDVHPAVVYLDASSATPTSPYDSRATAATTVADALSVAGAGSKILIAPGSYPQAHQNVITVPMSIVGESGKPEDVIIRNTTGLISGSEAYRLFKIDNADALLANVSIVDGAIYASSGSNEGGGIRMTGGVVSNCVIRNCQARQSSNPHPLGGGIYMNGADSLLTHCVVSNCSVSGDANWLGYMGGGVHMVKGRVENTLVVDCCDKVNIQPGFEKTIGGIYAEAGSVVNCTVLNCRGSKAGGIFVNGSAVVSNTVAFNDYKILKTSADPLTVVTNVCDFLGTETQFVHSLSNVTAAAFADYANRDFRPSPTGALFNAGINISGWDKLTDLGGKKRIVRGTIDVGCYEFQTRGGMKVILR